MSPSLLWTLAILACVASVLVLLLWRESGRRTAWFAAAREALGGTFGPVVEAEDLADSRACEGTLDGAKARFAADNTTTHARLEIALPEGTDKGAVFDLVVRERGNAIETGTEDVTAGYDVETERIVVKARAVPDAAATVRALLEETRAFRDGLPALLAKNKDARGDASARVFGELTGKDGRHAELGIGLSLPPEEWEPARVGRTGIEWERVLGDGPPRPATLRLGAAPQDPALADPGARDRLLERVGLAFQESLPDGSFEGEPPAPAVETAEPLGGQDVHEVRMDFRCELDLEDRPGDEGKVEVCDYRFVARGVFAPWAVLVLSVQAPRDEALPLLERVLRGATLAEPKKS